MSTQKVMVQPINLIFRFLQTRAQGFDEFMNVVLDEAEEVRIKDGKSSEIGRLMLKGDNITLIQAVQDDDPKAV